MPDSQLQVALRGVVRAIDQLPTLEKPEIAAVEGSEATIEAFRRLTATFFGLLSFELPPSADELRQLQQKAVQSIDNPAALHALNNKSVGLSKRDYIPLGVAVFVDLCLLLVSIGRPMNRFVATRQSMIEAERGPVFPILSRFSEIHNHEEMRRTFDVFREVISNPAAPTTSPYPSTRPVAIRCASSCAATPRRSPTFAMRWRARACSRGRGKSPPGWSPAASFAARAASSSSAIATTTWRPFPAPGVR